MLTFLLFFQTANWDNSVPNNGNVESPKSPLPFTFGGEEEEKDPDVCNGSWIEEEEMEEDGFDELSEDNDDDGEDEYEVYEE